MPHTGCAAHSDIAMASKLTEGLTPKELAWFKSIFVRVAPRRLSLLTARLLTLSRGRRSSLMPKASKR